MECVVCQSPSKILYSNLSDRVHTDVIGTYTLRQCPTCDLLFINPPPPPEKLIQHYPENYHVYERKLIKLSTRQEWITKLVAKHYLGYGRSNFFMRILLTPFYYKLMHLPQRVERGKILDVGCGTGTRLPMFKLLGWQSEGIEMSQQAANIANESGFKVQCGSLENINAPENWYDVVYLNNVFEHFVDPVDALKKIRRILKPNGQLALVVPNKNSLGFKLFRQHWFALEVPRHLFTFNRYNITKLLVKRGFIITKTRYCYNFGSFSSSLANYFNKPIENFAFIDRLTWLMAFILDPVMNVLGIGDWMVVHARREAGIDD